mmetsp:Transcript_33497/g.34130  ORF Transcript_33497/g.34130 Transcript_33497/m.34130 type:complete len:130 (+) Transcript_33497:106-495(+)
MFPLIFLAFICLISSNDAFLVSSKPSFNRAMSKTILLPRVSPINAIPSQFSFSLMLAEGLDAETLGAMGNVEDLNNALVSTVDASSPTVSIINKLLSSPAILAVPILAGLLVASGIGYFIISWGQGRDD